jgi:two-component system, NarL family, nitrate/nitrite response regulator NarL
MRCNERSDRRPSVVLQGLTNILGAASFKVVASCSGGTNCIQAIRSLASDIVIIDISMPGLEILAIANSKRSFHASGPFHRIG